jgi:hypothetical protein
MDAQSIRIAPTHIQYKNRLVSLTRDAPWRGYVVALAPGLSARDAGRPPEPVPLAVTNKCLARINKSSVQAHATNKRGALSRRKLNMSLYFFLSLLAVLTGFATSLAIIYECVQRFRRRKPPVVLPLDGLQRDRPARPTEEWASKRPSDFTRLCASIKDLPPKQQASRVRDYFGILGGARPAEGRDRKGKRLTPGEIQRLEQRSRTRL